MPITAATCKIRDAHTPHERCPGSAPEFPWERIVVPDPNWNRCDCRTVNDQGGEPRFWPCPVHG